ncbi:MAG: hypothetical protein IJV14_11210 [Lachnospiraceae bacterium]|nr:hypothetical protein [Lachnospiraceae bacterium]
MGAILKLLLFFIWAGLIPVLMGLLPTSYLAKHRRRSHIIIISGYLCAFSLFEILGVPILFFLKGDFDLLVRLYSIISPLMAAAGVIRCIRMGGARLPAIVEVLAARRMNAENETMQLIRQKRSSAGQAILFWAVFLALFAFQIYMAYTRASYDGDDAYYVAQSLISWQTGTMYRWDPYTGVSTSLDGRHAMAMLPMWIAAISRLCGTHSTIVTHSMIPMIFLPLSDLCYYAVGKALLYKESPARRLRMLPAFMIVIALIQIYGNVSIYTPETFLLMRTWQGKTVFANVLIPMTFYSLLLITHRLEEGRIGKFPWIVMVLVNTAAGLCTSLAPVMTSMLFIAGCLCIALSYRYKKVMFFGLLSCIPGFVYAVIIFALLLPNFLAGGLNIEFLHSIFG